MYETCNINLSNALNDIINTNFVGSRRENTVKYEVYHVDLGASDWRGVPPPVTGP